MHKWLNFILPRNALESGGKVFFTDVNEENGTRVKKELQKEFGNDKVGFSVQNVSDAKNWVQVRDRNESISTRGYGVSK